jgi:hypothetical protein
MIAKLKSMRRSRRVLVLSLGIVFIGLIGYYIADPTSIAQLESNRASYDGRFVTIRGTVRAHVQRTSRIGNPYSTFFLCDDRCVRIFTFGYPNIANGDTKIIFGRYSVVRRVGYARFYNEIEGYFL